MCAILLDKATASHRDLPTGFKCAFNGETIVH